MAPTFQRFVVARHKLVPELVPIFVSLFRFQMKSLDHDVHTSLAMLRRHINVLQSPIYRLPSDVFSEVASHLQPESDLIRFTHVSYRLRAALLSDPSLWSYIDSSHKERAQAFLQRSGQTPLHLSWVEYEHQKFPLLPSHMARLVSLEMCNCESQKEATLSQPMPALRSLRIDGSIHYEAGGVENLPLWSLTSVTSLIVHNVTPIRLHIPHLTRFGFVQGDEETSIDPLLEFLDNCPLLEDLSISIKSESPHSLDRIVSLPNLRNYAQCTRSGHHSLRLFNMLFLPPTCSVTVRRVIQPSAAAAEDVIPPFRNPDHLDGITRIKLRTSSFHIHDGVTLRLEFTNAKGAKVCLEQMVHGCSREYIPSDVPNLAYMGCLPDLNPKSVEILCIERYGLRNQGDPAIDDVRNVLGCLPGLTTIILSFTDVTSCLQALDVGPDAGSSPRHSPSVHTLVIHSDFYSSTWSRTLQILLTIAQRRKLAGSPFRSVSLFLWEDPQSGWILDQLRECIERFEVTVEDKVLQWDVDKYFLAGLDHLQDRRDVWCDQVDDHTLRVRKRSVAEWEE